MLTRLLAWPVLFSLAACGTFGSAAKPTSTVQATEPPKDRLAVPFGLGFSADPTTFLIGGAVDIPVAPLWTIGPALEVGASDDTTLVAPTFQVKRFLPVRSDARGLENVTPYVQAGLGLVYLQEDRRPGIDDDDIGLLLDVGGGVRWRFSDDASVGSQLLFHIVPGEVLDEGFYFSWEVAQLVVDF